MRFILLRSIALCWVAGIVLTMSASAQTDYSYRSATSFLTVGAGFAAGVSMAVQDPSTGNKIGPQFAYRTGLNVMYPLSSVASLTLDLGLDARGNKVRSQADADVYGVTSLRYFSITPGIRLSSFWFGLNIGLPIGGDFVYKGGTGYQEVSNGYTGLRKDSLSTMIEPRLGVTVPILDQKNWWLGMTFNVGYAFTNFYDAKETSGGIGTYNGSMASAHLGLTAQFAIPGTGRK